MYVYTLESVEIGGLKGFSSIVLTGWQRAKWFFVVGWLDKSRSWGRLGNNYYYAYLKKRGLLYDSEVPELFVCNNHDTLARAIESYYNENQAKTS